MSDDSDDLSTTASSGSETDSSEEADNLRANSEAFSAAANGLDSTTASAREEFKRLTRETDEKNKALQRDRSTHSDLGRASPLSSDSASSDSEGAGGAARRGAESKNQDNNDSGSESGSDTSGDSPKAASGAGAGAADGGKGGSRMVSGQHHDEEMDLEMSSDTVDTTVYNQQLKAPGGASAGGAKSTLKTASGSSDSDTDSSSSGDMSAPNISRDDMPTNEYEGLEKRPSPKLSAMSPSSGGGGGGKAQKAKGKGGRGGGGSDSESTSTDDSDSDSDSDSEGSSPRAGGGGGVKRKNYDNLRVSAEIKEIFQYVDAFEPQTIELETQLKPFIPEFIPSIGVPDVFVKMPRPDEVDDRLGLAVLDEPAAHQTDTEIFAMQLRSSSKVRISGDAAKAIPCIEYAEKKDEAVQQWIDNIEDLHRNKPPTNVVYAHPMPDLNDAMRVWPPEFEAYLASHAQGGDDNLGFSADLDISLEEFARAACGLVDIPVHDGHITESLHVFFTLWDEFRSNQHFQGGGGAVSGAGPSRHLLDSTDYRLSTPEAIEAAMAQSDHRPTTAEGIRQAMENSMKDQRPSTSTHVKHITGNYRPDTAAAIEAVQRMEQQESNSYGK